ncbi:hypothetical protein [Polaribacter sp.]|uniref:hypothetical protein n=1 Tax=Polaribacter sp. TaxID=1920175 RepID=UPI0026163547|nr:hypothetical protein [Polaribacter sp.]MDG1402800.1 hypothetical protein [Polaribacter sp.]
MIKIPPKFDITFKVNLNKRNDFKNGGKVIHENDFFISFSEMKPTAVILAPIFLEETKLIVSKLEKLQIPSLFLNIAIDGFNNVLNKRLI